MCVQQPFLWNYIIPWQGDGSRRLKIDHASRGWGGGCGGVVERFGMYLDTGIQWGRYRRGGRVSTTRNTSYSRSPPPPDASSCPRNYPTSDCCSPYLCLNRFNGCLQYSIVFVINLYLITSFLDYYHFFVTLSSFWKMKKNCYWFCLKNY